MNESSAIHNVSFIIERLGEAPRAELNQTSQFPRVRGLAWRAWLRPYLTHEKGLQYEAIPGHSVPLAVPMLPVRRSGISSRRSLSVRYGIPYRIQRPEHELVNHVDENL